MHAQSCLTLWDPMYCSPPGASIHGIILARILVWVAVFLLHGVFPTQGSNSCLTTTPALAGRFFTTEPPAAAAKSLQSCPTLCDHIDGSPSGSPIPGILQARTLQWVAISFSDSWKWKVKVKSLSRVRPSVTPWTAAYQGPPSMGFSRQEYWSGVPLPSPTEPSEKPLNGE